MRRRPIAALVCAATLLQAGCGGSGSEETIRVPQLRLGGPGEQTLSLAASSRIERRNAAGVPELESARLRREVWVLTRAGDTPSCAKLGDASVASDGSSDEFVLQVDAPPDAAVNPALTLLDELPVAADVSLLVLWSVAAPSAGAEDRPLLLDAAEYALIKGLPPPPEEGGRTEDGADPEPKNLIYLVEPEDRPAVDGMIAPVAEEADLTTCATLDLTRDPDGDGISTLDELNAGLPIEEVVAGSTPLADGTLVDDPVDVVVVRSDRSSGDPLAPTWRVFRPTAPEASRGGRLELPPIGEDGDPLELRVATASDGSSMLVEAAFPEDYPTSDGALSMDVTFDVPGDGAGEMSFRCLEGFPSSIASLSGDLPSEAPTTSPSEGVYLAPSEDERTRLTVRCDSKEFMPSGRLSLAGVRVSVSPSDPEGGGTSVDEVWELRDLEVFVHDAPSASGPTGRP